MKRILFFLLFLPSLAFAQLELPYSIKVNNPKPLDYYYFESDGTPYESTSEATTAIPSGVRYQGMTVNVVGVEYWFEAGVTDGDLVVKLPFWETSGTTSIIGNTNIQIPGSSHSLDIANTNFLAADRVHTTWTTSGFSVFQGDTYDAALTRLRVGTGNIRFQSVGSATISGGTTAVLKVTDDSNRVIVTTEGVSITGDLNTDGTVQFALPSDIVIDNNEVSYLDGVTSAIQTQIDSKLTAASTASTGTDVAFDIPRTYGYATDATGNITFTTTGLVEGMTQLMIHNDSSEPTFESGMVVISGTYQTGVDNYIMFMAVKSSLILVTISQAQ